MKKLAKPTKTFQLADLKRLSNDELRAATGGEGAECWWGQASGHTNNTKTTY